MRFLGIARSLMMYYGRPWRTGQMARFYAPFMQAGDLCFDIGAHVGNRTRAWLRLGARVIAIEPQPAFVQILRQLYGSNSDVTILDQAVGSEPGQGTLLVSQRTPTVTTLSASWAENVSQTPSFAKVHWDTTVSVTLTTLDKLISEYGIPAFCKIDVEGFEFEVLKGLSQPLPALSVEYIPADVDLTGQCIEQLCKLGAYEFNYSQGESLRWGWQTWRDAQRTIRWLESTSSTDPSGDLYARRLRQGA